MKIQITLGCCQEPSIPRKTRLGLIDKAFGAQADRVSC